MCVATGVVVGCDVIAAEACIVGPVVAAVSVGACVDIALVGVVTAEACVVGPVVAAVSVGACVDIAVVGIEVVDAAGAADGA